MRKVLTVFQLGRMNRVDLLAEFLRAVPPVQGGAMELRAGKMTNEAIITTILNMRQGR